MSWREKLRSSSNDESVCHMLGVLICLYTYDKSSINNANNGSWQVNVCNLQAVRLAAERHAPAAALKPFVINIP